jgi:hypothetical protein
MMMPKAVAGGPLALVIAIVALLALFVGGAITFGPVSAQPRAMVTETSSPTPANHDPVFLIAVRSQFPALANTADATLIQIGTQGCRGFTGGKTWSAVTAGLSADSASTRATTEWIIAAGTEDYCPQFIAKLTP